jgi:hypothetical protein
MINMFKLKGFPLAVAMILLMLGIPARAELVSYGNGLVYDDVLDVTWTKDANLAKTRKFGIVGIQDTGRMTWDTAQRWIAAMNTANFKGFNNWRLWSAKDYETGKLGCVQPSLCNKSELGHLFYEEGGLSPGSPITSSATLTSKFTGMMANPYWSGSEVPSNLLRAYYFRACIGAQNRTDKTTYLYVWPVRDGKPQ